VPISKQQTPFDYKTRPLPKEISVHKQAAKRYFGCNAYFTRQSWDIVRAYIKNFSKIDDLVLDPFAGSGITPIEALLTDRRAIALDINPLSVFMMQALIAPVNVDELMTAYEKVCTEYEKKAPKDKKDADRILKTSPLP
jgi:DNA modification methylase